MPIKKSVLVDIFDKPRNIRFDVNAISDLEELLGMGVGEIVGNPKVSGFRTVRGLVWAGLKHEDPTLTPQKAGDLMQDFMERTGKGIDVIASTVSKAILESGAFDTKKKADPQTGEPAEPLPNG